MFGLTRKSNNRKARTLQAERDQVQEVDKLAKHNALCSCILTAQIGQFFY